MMRSWLRSASVETGGGEGEEAAGDADAIFGAGDAPDESLFESFADSSMVYFSKR